MNELLEVSRRSSARRSNKARQEKLIGNALEAAVVLRCDVARSQLAHER